MKSALEAIRARALERLQNAEDLTALEEARVQLLGKKGELTVILKTMGQLSPEERPAMGQMANEVRAAIEEKLAARGAALKAAMACPAPPSGRATATPSISCWMRSRRSSSAWALMWSPAPRSSWTIITLKR